MINNNALLLQLADVVSRHAACRLCITTGAARPSSLVAHSLARRYMTTALPAGVMMTIHQCPDNGRDLARLQPGAASVTSSPLTVMLMLVFITCDTGQPRLFHLIAAMCLRRLHN